MGIRARLFSAQISGIIQYSRQYTLPLQETSQPLGYSSQLRSLDTKKPRWVFQRGFFVFGGGGGIRTHVRFNPKHTFQACALSHSATSPKPLPIRLS